MLLIMLVLGTALLIWGIYDSCGPGDSGHFRCGIGILFITVAVVGCMFLIVDLREIDTEIPDKIAYLEENNAAIEAELLKKVEDYKTCEQDTFTVFAPSPESDIAIAIPPALKSDTIAACLLETYHSNNEEIRKMKLRQLNRPMKTFWLYLGSR